MRTRVLFLSSLLVLISTLADASLQQGVFYLTDDGAIGSWLHLGVIPDAPESQPLSGRDASYLPNEESASPVRGESVVIRDATYAWTPFYHESGVVRLSDFLSPSRRVSSYFFCFLESDRDVELILQVACDDTAKVWLGGIEIYDHADSLPNFDKYSDIKASVQKGRQSLLVKVCQNEGFWGFDVRLKDGEGKTPQGLRIVLPGEFADNEYLDSFVCTATPPLVDKNGKQMIRLRFPSYADPKAVESLTVYEADKPDRPVWTGAATDRRYLNLPVARRAAARDVILRVGLGGRIFEKKVTVEPCRDWKVYLLPGSHVDIGYTNLQSIVMDDHKKFFRQAWDLYEESLQKDYMHDAHYIWNPEVTWVIKDFLKTESDADCKRLLDYLRRGVFSLDALYCNVLTALCGDEELIRSVYYSMHLAEREHIPPVVSAMITDVPGYTWGTVPVLAGSGVKYFDLGPNLTARIGFATKSLGSRPYYWIGPDGQSKVLVWNTGYGYSNTFNMLQSESGVDQFLTVLSQYEADPNYPYDIAKFRAYLVDNTPPPTHLSHMAQEWNQQYQVPHIILSGAPAPFQALEKKYADRIPSYSGDYTPYWEDGAASSARESAMNRTATLRLQEADKAWSLARAAGGPLPVPSKELEKGYDFAMLYSEHTWGAHNSITQPESPFAMDQWRVKRSFAENSLWLSSQLKKDGLKALSNCIASATPFSYAVWNLTQWPRTGEAVLPVGDTLNPLENAEQWIAVDSDGVRSPVLRDDRGYAFQANDVPSYGYKVYQFLPQPFEIASPEVSVNATDGILQGGDWEVKVDPKTGAAVSVLQLSNNRQWVDADGAYRLNQYLHALGPDGAQSQTVGRALLSVNAEGGERYLSVDAEGRGVEWLSQDVRLYPNQNRIDFINTMNKSDIRDKEAVRFAFPFKVPEGRFTLEIPLASMHPETEQIPGANRNIYTVRRWIDISNKEYGVTLVTHDAPLVELCDMHAEREWMEKLPLANTHLFSYAMNNYWFTNYKASQGGPAIFRYSLYFHDGPGKPSQSTQFADKVTSPLCVVPLRVEEGASKATLPSSAMSLVSIDNPNVLIQNLKWAESGEGLIVRLRELDGVSTNAQIRFNLWKKFQWKRCDIVERPIEGEFGATEEGVLPIAIRGKEIRTYLIQPIK